MKEDMVKLSEVLEKINGFKNGKVTQEELDAWCPCIKFNLSLTTRKKCEIINDIINGGAYSNDIVDSFVELEMNKFWYGMLSYTNIDISETKLLTEENYEILNMFLYSWILGYIEKDYNVFLQMFDRMYIYMTNTVVAQTLIESIAEIGIASEKNSEDFMSFIKENPKTLNDLAQIASMGSQIQIPRVGEEETE